MTSSGFHIIEMGSVLAFGSFIFTGDVIACITLNSVKLQLLHRLLHI